MTCKPLNELRERVLVATARHTYNYCKACGAELREGETLKPACGGLGFLHVTCPNTGDPFRNWRP